MSFSPHLAAAGQPSQSAAWCPGPDLAWLLSPSRPAPPRPLCPEWARAGSAQADSPHSANVRHTKGMHRRSQGPTWGPLSRNVPASTRYPILNMHMTDTSASSDKRVPRKLQAATLVAVTHVYKGCCAMRHWACLGDSEDVHPVHQIVTPWHSGHSDLLRLS